LILTVDLFLYYGLKVLNPQTRALPESGPD
jgi:hypothetical protein